MHRWTKPTATTRWTSHWTSVLALGVLACSSSAGPQPPRAATPRAGQGADTPAANGGSGAQTADAAGSAATPGSNTPGLLTPTPAPPTAGSDKPADGSCASTSVSAPPAGDPRVDIIWVVDASGSMLDEQMKIGANLTAFADRITQASIDVHIVMMTTSAAIPVICPEMSHDPLAGSALASDPRYMFIDSVVDSYNALDVAVGNFGMYASFLRPGAATHFVIVSDDESRYKNLGTPEEREAAFATDMHGMLGHDFTLHTVSSEGPTACRDPNCMPDTSTGICAFVMLGCGAAAPGTTYYGLADMTHGLSASICQSDWKAIFDPLSAAVIASAPLPCSYLIPAPPSGEKLDASKVNVRWMAPGATSDMLFGKATASDACQDALGWYYDAPTPPTQILLCPATCSAIAAGGTLSIGYGCATFELN